jgi:hypothetical protein
MKPPDFRNGIDPKWVQETIHWIYGFYLYPFQLEDICDFLNGGIFTYALQTDGGKAGALDTPVFTPRGWTTLGQLRLGDQVFGSDGQPTTVIAATEPMQGRPCYEVEFADESKIVCDASHEWCVWDENVVAENPQWSRQAGRFRVLTTAYLASTYDTSPKSGKNLGRYRKYRYGIRTRPILRMPPQEQLIDPYLMGVWLGDGTTTSSEITVGSKDRAFIAEQFEAAGYTMYHGKTYVRARGFRVQLRAAGVLGRKHIPEVYLHGDARQRLELLRGLMDTDGSASTGDSRRVEFCSTNENLAEGVAFLARSLGWKPHVAVGRANLYGRDCGPKWRVTWTAFDEMSPFRMPRKTALLRARLTTSRTANKIVGIHSVPSVPVRCIQVANSDGIFLWGKNLIATHNSFIVEAVTILRLIIDPNRRIVGVKVNEDAGKETMIELAKRLRAVAERYPHVRPLCRWMGDKEEPRTQVPMVSEGFWIAGASQEVLGADRDINKSVRFYGLWESALQGKRGDFMADDVERMEEARSAARRESLDERIAVLARVLRDSPDALWLVAGTPTHGQSILFRIARMLDQTGIRFKQIHRPYTNPDGTLLIPSRAGKTKIHQKLMKPTQWASAYELRPLGGSNLDAKQARQILYDPEMPFIENEDHFREWIGQQELRSKPPEASQEMWEMRAAQIAREADLIIDWDPAPTGDWAICVTASRPPNYYVLRVRLSTGDTWEQVSVVNGYAALFPSAVVVIEKNAQQKVYREVLEEISPHLQIYGHGTYTQKEMPSIGIPGMLADMRDGKIKVPGADLERAEDEFYPLFQELVEYGPTAHPHIIIAIWFGWYWVRRHGMTEAMQRAVSYQGGYLRDTLGPLMPRRTDGRPTRANKAWNRRHQR